MRLSKKQLCILICLVLSVLIAGCGGSTSSGGSEASGESKSAVQYMTFGASPASSQFYTYWVSVGKAVQTAYPEYQISVSETQGAVDATKRVNSGDLLVAISTSSSDYENYMGIGAFEGNPNPDARLMWYFDVSPMQVVVSKDSGITSLVELNGQKFSPGGTGTAAAMTMRQILEVLEIEPDFFEAGQGDAGDAVSNRQIVGATKAGIVPDSFVMQIAANIPVDIVSFTDEEVEKVCAALPYLTPVTIPAGAYDGVDHEIKTVQFLQGAQGSIQLSQEDGYKIIKAMWEDGKEVWTEAYPQGADIHILELALTSAIPLHSGTVQYLEEQGYEVPEHLIPPEYNKVA